jgi:zinc protease
VSRRISLFLILPLFALALLFSRAPAQAIEAQRVVSPGGIEAWLVEDHSIPVIALSVGFRGGSSLDPVGKEGLANMVSGLLDEGAAERDSQTFRAVLEQKAISLSFSSTLDSFSGSLRTLTENRDLAFGLLADALHKPRFDAEPVERVRSQVLTSLAFDRDDPQTQASEAWYKLAFAGHPYARSVSGDETTVKGLEVKDFTGFVKTHLTLDRMKIGVAGDITSDQLAALLDQTFGGLEKTSPLKDPAQVMPKGGMVQVIERPIPQAVAVFGGASLPRDDQDFYAAYVVNYILGAGGFSSRLMDEVREKRGLAYSVYSYLYPFDHAPALVGGVATKAERMKDSLALIGQEFARMAKDGPTQQELDDAKTYLIGAYPLRFTSTPSVAAILMSLQLDGYPIDHLQKRNDYVRAVTLDDAKRAAARLLADDGLTITVVGTAPGVESTP